MMMPLVTPRPWACQPTEDGGEEYNIVAPYPGLPGEPLFVAQTFGMAPDCGDPAANAAFICKAVNLHDELVIAASHFASFIRSDYETRRGTIGGGMGELYANLQALLTKAGA